MVPNRSTGAWLHGRLAPWVGTARAAAPVPWHHATSSPPTLEEHQVWTLVCRCLHQHQRSLFLEGSQGSVYLLQYYTIVRLQLRKGQSVPQPKPDLQNVAICHSFPVWGRFAIIMAIACIFLLAHINIIRVLISTPSGFSYQHHQGTPYQHHQGSHVNTIMVLISTPSGYS